MQGYIRHGIATISMQCLYVVAIMPCLKSVASLISCTILLVLSTIDAHDYYSAMEQSMRSDDVMSVQTEQTCPLSGACEVCHTAQIGSGGYFHVCPDDGKQWMHDT